MNTLKDSQAFPGIEGTNGYGAAFPIQNPNGDTIWVNCAQGMTYRQWLSGMAMHGILASLAKNEIFAGYGQLAKTLGVEVSDVVALCAIQNADAMIRALEKESK